MEPSVQMVPAAIWGDIASILGLVLAFWALIKAANAQSAVEQAVRRNKHVLLALELSQAIETGKLLLTARHREAWMVHCDALRDRLASCRQHPLLARNERIRIESAVADMTRIQFRDEHTIRWSRELTNFLIQTRRRLLDLVVEQ